MFTSCSITSLISRRKSSGSVMPHIRSGRLRALAVTSAQPSVQLYGSADDRRGFAEIARAYTVLGVQHILMDASTVEAQADLFHTAI